MVVAKSGYIHQRCMTILHTDDFRREYRGICDGVPQPPAGTIALPISRQPGSLLKRSIDPDGLPSQTEYETLSVSHGRALLRLRPLTGRTHQLRLHCAYMGYPILGDPQYGTEESQAYSLAQGIGTQLLCAKRIQFVHPITGAAMCLESEMDV